MRLLAWTIAVLAALAGCGSSDDGRTQNSETSGVDAGVCARDLAGLDDLLAHPVACVGTAQCPAGAYCDTQRGTCDFECTADAACGPGASCSCDGHCSNGSSGGGGGACTRSAGLLRSVATRTCASNTDCGKGLACDLTTHACVVGGSCAIDADCLGGEACVTVAGVKACAPKVCTSDADCGTGVACDGGQCHVLTPRACTFDDQCPDGSRCDAVTRACRYDCAADADCATGQACDCLGACVTPGTTPTVPGDREARLTVTPAESPVIEATPGTTPWAPVRLSASLIAANDAAATASKDVDVHVAASQGLVIACGSEHAPAPTAYATSCVLSAAWTFAPGSDAQVATQYVWVKPTSASVLAGEVSFTSDHVSGSPAVATFGSPTPTGAPPSPQQVPFAGEYTGTMTMLGTGWYSLDASGGLVPSADARAAAMPAAFPVRAWASETDGTQRTIDFFDATRTLAENGKLRASSRLFTYANWLSVIDEYAPPSPPSTNAYRAKTILASQVFDPATGILRGVLVVIPRQGADPIGIQFTLTRTAAATQCAAGCTTGQTCTTDLGICEAGDAWANGEIYDGATPIAFTDTVPSRWFGVGSAVGAQADNLGIYWCLYHPCGTGPILSRPPAFPTGADGAARVLCSRAADGTDKDLDGFDPSGKMAVSGDLRCIDGHVPHGADLVYDADRALEGGVQGTASIDMLAACASDLIAQPPVLPPLPILGSNWPPDAVFTGLTATHTCFSPAHFYGALKRLAFAGNTDPAQNKLAGRLLAQWLTIHGFLAKETVQERGMSDAAAFASDLDDQENAAVHATPSLSDVLRELERGWDVVLADPERSVLVDGTYVSPDYRTGASGGEQTVALPVQVLETAALHLDATTAFLRQAQLDTYAQCHASGTSVDAVTALRRAGRAFRYTTHAESAAVWAYEHATGHWPLLTNGQLNALCTTGTNAAPGIPFPFCSVGVSPQPVTPSWQARWDAARAQYEAARQHAMSAAVALSTCENPLGLPENGSIPLFFGDVTGTSSRFFASSDYLLNGWAAPAVEHARASLEAARTAWAEKRNSENQQILTQQEVDRRREGLTTSYGQQLVDLCGLDTVPATDALAAFTGTNPLRAETCFIKSPAPECERYVAEALGESPTSPVGPAQPAPNTGATTDPAPVASCSQGPSLNVYRLHMCIANTLHKELASQDPKVLAFMTGYQSASAIPYASCPTLISKISSGGQTLSANEVMWYSQIFDPDPSQFELDAVTATCRDQIAGEADDPPYVPDATSYAACFRGQLGEQILGTMGARKTVQLALMDWWDAQKLYDMDSSYCDHLKQWQISAVDLDAWHRDYTHQLDQARGLVMGMLSGSPTAPGESLVGALFGNAMEDADAKYQAEMSTIKNEQELYACYQEARKTKLRIDNAAVAIEGAIAQADEHTVAFRDLQTKLRNLVTDGNAALVREDGRKVPNLAFHYWLDEKVDRFHKDFEWAKSLAYLSMLAVEYEYQQSLGLRDQILRATNPDQLLDAIQTMQQTQISRTIDGRRPEDAHLVRSLVSDVLHLDDQHPTVAGERQWSKLERFQHRLWSPEYAVYDEHGAYLGQGIPFSLAPDGELTYACAEKLWTVTATIQGDGLSALAPSAPLMLLKRNQFASQWCSGQGDGSPMQTASVQPPSQLFHPESRGGEEAAVHQFVTARISPWFNVPRSELFRDAYAEGASQELAGRGLYGDYVLLFPAEGLLRGGFPLTKVEDVLLRFDYLSVDNLSVSNRTASDGDDQ